MENMTSSKDILAEKLRSYIAKYGINDFNEERLEKTGLTLKELKANFTDRQDMVKTVLEYERKCLSLIHI